MQIVPTDDGSDTLYVPEINEHYHSVFGAITESDWVFIRSGLQFSHQPENISVFEVGFGTGLNALLACNWAITHNRQISYYTIEKFPIPMDIIGRLNFTDCLPAIPGATDLFHTMHRSPWNEIVHLHPRFSMQKIQGDMTIYNQDSYHDVVFFDAFSPDRQPEMWTTEIFRKLYDHMHSGGVLTTYCVKGLVKRRLKEAGFTIEKLPGPPGKREILRAVK
ncbi:MAG: tRNA (5-methylaminomethyl-2-thiouridine)(34)-methyltransferase MnmD [Bacteroidales bacterium]|nr:tRNA (5-methylaminomethyl-2-thiouridine)(34)-methyltransferase MnmD [Bacteroidales bacterium]